MFMKDVFIILLLILTNCIFGQQIQYVNVHNGLIVRKKLQKGSEITEKLEYGTRVGIIKKTEIKFQGFSLQMELEIWGENKDLKKNQNDTAKV